VKISNPISDYLEFSKTIPELKSWCKENNLDSRKTIRGLWKMFQYKSMINRMIKNLVEEGIDNSAIPVLSALLCGINVITEQPNQDYSWEALNSLMIIYQRIITVTGYPSVQFELMIQIAMT
jgi:hypothetical protein